MAEYLWIDTEKARSYCADLFGSYGFTSSESRIITDVLIRADLYGIESHGVQRLVRYHDEIVTGMVEPKSKPETLHETAISATIDAKKAMGQLVGVQAMELAIEKAQKSGCGMVTVRNSNHYGIASYYTEMAAKADLLGICMSNSEAISVPVFGRQPMLGTNPIAFAMPAEPLNFSYDAATTVIPRGKLEVFVKNNKPLPDQWAMDSEGKPCTDAALVLNNIIHKLGGGIAPIGAHKGYGLGIIVDLLTAILSGGLSSNYVNITPGLNGICHWFMAVDYGIFGDKKAIKAHASTFMRELRESRKAEGQERIYTHGEIEAEIMAGRINGQIPANEKTLAEMKNIAEKQGVSWIF